MMGVGQLMSLAVCISFTVRVGGGRQPPSNSCTVPPLGRFITQFLLLSVPLRIQYPSEGPRLPRPFLTEGEATSSSSLMQMSEML